ncbi:MAG: hypothetical protein GF408_04515 [Candidatus Omnitrophica bacterium]|nr:hypothetical protein [Candidatus Omnitrophota bacterium]
MEDKRRNFRHNVFLNPPGCSKSGCERTEVDINDISSDGIGIKINKRLTRGDSIELEVLLPGDDIPMFVHGEVAWICRDKTREGIYDAGISLVKFHRHDRTRLVKYLHSGSANS